MRALLAILIATAFFISVSAKKESSLQKLVRKLPESIPDEFQENFVRLHRSRSHLKSYRSPENLGLQDHLKTFVEVKKIDPLVKSIRAMTSKAYRSLGSTLSTLACRHGLQFNAKTADKVLKDAVSAIGESRRVLQNATANFGMRIVKAMKGLNISLTQKQATALTGIFSSWLTRRHVRLQKVLRRCLARHGVAATHGELQSVATETLATLKLSASLSRVKPGLDHALKMDLSGRLHEFMSQSHIDVSQLVKDRGVRLDSSKYHLLIPLVDSNVSWAMSEVLTRLHIITRRLMTDLPLPKNHVGSERLLRDLTAGANIAVKRLARFEFPLIFNRNNATADDNALLLLAHRAMKERAGLEGITRELRMKVRIPLSYPQAIARASVVHSEIRREVGRVAQVLPEEVDVLSMDDGVAVRFRIIARGFDPVWAEQRLREAIAKRQFMMRIDGHQVSAIPPPIPHLDSHSQPSSILVGAISASVITLLLFLTVTALFVRRRRCHGSTENDNSVTKIPYAKVCEPETVCA